MSAEIINLRRARKSKTRDEAGKQAQQNRVTFGRSKIEKNRSASELAREKKKLDGHQRDQIWPKT